MSEKKLKLTIELVPSTSWYNNLRSVMKPKEWDTLRKKVYADYHYRCGICGSGGILECHELWEYDDMLHVQKLRGFIALCDMCHRVKHIGLAELEADRGNLDYDALVNHFVEVNRCDKNTFIQHRHDALQIWDERSKFQWTVEINGLPVG